MQQHLDRLAVAFRVPDEYVRLEAGGPGRDGPGGIEVLHRPYSEEECQQLLAEKRAKDNDEELPPLRDPSLAPVRREFDEEAFKATNEFYLKLVEANAPEQQRALLNMYKTVCAGEFLNVLIHGGPGTGKTFFMGVMQEALAKLNVHFTVMAPSGVAAAIHSSAPGVGVGTQHQSQHLEFRERS